jgi:Ca2+-binding EF-hand superfamily protein
MLYNGGGLLQCFKTLDTDRSNYITADELHAGLEKLGATDLTLRDCQDVVASLDENNDNKISYVEFSALLASWSGATRIDDPGHWAYHVFETIRRRV